MGGRIDHAYDKQEKLRINKPLRMPAHQPRQDAPQPRKKSVTHPRHAREFRVGVNIFNIVVLLHRSIRRLVSPAAFRSLNGTVLTGSHVTSAPAALISPCLRSPYAPLPGAPEWSISSNPSASAPEIFRARLQRQLHQLIFAGRFAQHNDLPLALKKPGDEAGHGNRPAVFGQQAADFRGGAIFVVRAQFNRMATPCRPDTS